MAQTYPVQATLNITPPYSVYLNDYTRTGSTMFATTFTFMDMTKPSVNVRFRIVIEGVGIEIRTKESYLGNLFVLPSGIPEIFYGDQLAEYFSAENLDFKGISKEEIIKNGALPEGVYRFTIEVLEYNRGVKISNSASSVAWLVLNDPPVLNMPDNNQEIITIDPQVVRFQWTPRHKGSPNSSFSTVYKLKIVEIWPDNRNPNDAINSMNPVFETTTANHYYVYSIVDPPLIAGRKYAYQVQAIPNSTLEQLDLFKNNGYSEVRAFRFGKICEPPLDINLLSAHNKSLDLYWQPAVNATAFTVHYRPSGKESNWYQKFTYLPDLTLNDLVPDEDYDIQVESHCDVQLSELSDTEVYKTTDTQNDFVCGPIEFTPNLENTTPLDYVFPGDYIEAGDFKIELVRV